MGEGREERVRKPAAEPDLGEVLRRQAEELRRPPARKRGVELEGAGLLGTVFRALLLVVLVGGSLFLLWSPEQRREVLVLLQSRWSELSREGEILPLPPPRAPVERIAAAETPTFQMGSPQRESTEVLYDEPGRAAPPESRPAFVAPSKSPQSSAAFQMLQEKSPLVARLVEGQLQGYRFLDWKPLKDEAPLFWISLTVLKESQGQNVEMVWTVNTESGRVSAFNFYAKDFEMENRP